MPDPEGETNRLKIERSKKVRDSTRSGRRKLIGMTFLILLTKVIKSTDLNLLYKELYTN